MNFKTKAIGLLAGSALALGLTTGAMAQTGGTTILLDDSDCTASFGGSDIDFGTYVWNGEDAYELEGDPGNTTLTISVTDDTQAQDGCDVAISEGNMTGPNSAVINVDYNDGAQSADNPLTLSDVAGGTSPTVNVEIATALDDALDPGTYSGTVSIDTSAAS